MLTEAYHLWHHLTIIGSDNGLSPGRRQAIIWTNAGILLIGPLETNFSEISIAILIFSFKKMRLKVSSAKWRPFCLSLNVLTHWSTAGMALELGHHCFPMMAHHFSVLRNYLIQLSSIWSQRITHYRNSVNLQMFSSKKGLEYIVCMADTIVI